MNTIIKRFSPRWTCGDGGETYVNNARGGDAFEICIYPHAVDNGRWCDSPKSYIRNFISKAFI